MRLLGRKRKIDQFDDTRTQELGLPGLKVVAGEGDENHYTACLAAEPHECPLCHCQKIERKESRSHIYNDAIPQGGAQFVFDELTFIFNKYRCTNPECRHVFTPSIDFADPTTKGTYRFSYAVATSVMNMSYRRLKTSIPFSVTAQALGNTFRGWYEDRAAEFSRAIRTPSIIGVFTSSTQTRLFTILLDCDSSDIRILDVIPAVSGEAIALALSKYNRETISSFVISCSQLVAETLQEHFPDKQTYVPGWFVYESALRDYRDYITTNFRNLTDRERGMLHQAPISFPDSENEKSWVDSFLRKRKTLQDAFDHVQSLGYLVNRDWEYADLYNWAQLIPAESEKILKPTEECVTFFKDYLIAGRLHQDELPSSLYQELELFNLKIGEFDGTQPEVLRARILFADFDQGASNEQRQAGVTSLKQAIENLTILQSAKSRSYNRRRHRNVKQWREDQ